ncbi:Rossmann-like and DUF2520 domain-containing protein [Rubrolithibacter danxiaensis]|uniref:Rossmann-like and DUF2520 domain-containing protein n=1 Tax=Rubrolithibacter danxiaensis TaxID=3390805 RepID=UPI003BF86AAC
MKIVLLGSGNVATHLGKALKQVGHVILQVWSRSEAHAEELARELDAASSANIYDIIPDADLYIISISDDAITELAATLKLKDKLLVHTSGSVDISVLSGVSNRIGVLYPLQTFSKFKDVAFSEIPLAVEGSTPAIEEQLVKVAEQLTTKVLKLDSEKRKALHVAAVFACNFTNHLYAIANQILKEHGLSFDLIRPLIAETAAKVQAADPEAVQTGPAVRNDIRVIDKHVDFLQDHPFLKDLYEQLSKSIIKAHHTSQP